MREIRHIWVDPILWLVYFYDNQRNIIFRFLAFSELADLIVNGVEDVIGAAFGILADDVPETLLAEHLALFIKRFPDAVGADGDDLPVG